MSLSVVVAVGGGAGAGTGLRYLLVVVCTASDEWPESRHEIWDSHSNRGSCFGHPYKGPCIPGLGRFSQADTEPTDCYSGQP